jgi:predicted AAA+ superfamily ATPase
VAEALAFQLPVVTPRHLNLAALAGKADALIGMRRSGKTSILFEWGAALQRQDRSTFVYLNFEDERWGQFEATQLSEITDAIDRRRSEDSAVYLGLDEIQVVPEWEKFIRRLIDGRRHQIVVTGSSSKLLSTEIATSLRGRSLAHEVYPFSFAEALRHQGIASPSRWPVATAERLRLEKAFARYFAEGGFPEVQGLQAPLRSQVLRSYVDLVVLRDVIDRYRVSNSAALQAFAQRCFRSIGSKFSVGKTFRDLKASGHAVSQQTLHQFLRYFEDCFLFFPIPINAASLHVQQVNPAKIYSIDHGLARMMVAQREGNVGHLLENLVFIELRRRGFRLTYHHTKEGYEVDFVARNEAGELHELVQVCASLAEPETAAREWRALEAAITETGAKNATVVTMHERGERKFGRCAVRVVPAYEWLL